jgi:hypothetical protein
LLSGWRIGATLALVAVVFVFLLNLILTLWVSKNQKYKVKDGVGTIFQGSCAKVRKLNVWIHLLVNALGTILLCASNYCMQVLCSPNRQEIDCAHAQRRWLHIGVPSIHNVLPVGRNRSVLWVLLLLSSMPLHLLFNSVVFTNLQANNYMVMPTMEEWLHGEAYNYSGFVDYNITPSFDLYRPVLKATITLNNGAIVPRYQNVSTTDCFNSFSSQYISEVGNVYIVQGQPTVWRNQSFWQLGLHNRSGEPMWYRGEPPEWYDRVDASKTTIPFRSEPNAYPSNRWRCPSLTNMPCGAAEVPKDRSLWKPYDSPVEYCMIEQVLEICKA